MSRSPVLRCLRSSSLAMQYSGYASRRVFGVVCKGRKENMTGTSRDCFGHAEWKSAHVQQELAELLDVGDVRLVGDALQLVRP